MSRSTPPAISDSADPVAPAPPPVPRRRRAADFEPESGWFRRKAVPTWAVLVVAALMLGLGGVVATVVDDQPEQALAESDEFARSTALSASAPPSQPALSTTVERPTTTSTTTTAAPEPAPVSPDVSKAAVSWVFDRTRVQLAAIIERDPNVDSVDQFELDLAEDVIRLDVAFATRDRGADGSWELVRHLAAPMFSSEDGSFYTDEYTPGLELVTGGTTYTCSSDLMIRLASFAAGRSEFEKEC